LSEGIGIRLDFHLHPELDDSIRGNFEEIRDRVGVTRKKREQRLSANSRSLPAQYAALAGYVAAEAIIFVPLLYVAERFAPSTIRSAAAVSLLGFGGLTAIVFVTRKDFSFLRGVLMWAGIAALLLIVASVIFGFELGTFFSVAMIAFAGAAILYDTSNVLRNFPEDRYVAASLQLFASVALLFWYVLRLFMSAQRD